MWVDAQHVNLMTLQILHRLWFWKTKYTIINSSNPENANPSVYSIVPRFRISDLACGSGILFSVVAPWQSTDGVMLGASGSILLEAPWDSTDILSWATGTAWQVSWPELQTGGALGVSSSSYMKWFINTTPSATYKIRDIDKSKKAGGWGDNKMAEPTTQQPRRLPKAIMDSKSTAILYHIAN